jgi:hypothetical protein
MDKIYDLLVRFKDGHTMDFKAHKEELQKAGNAQKFVFNILGPEKKKEVKMIKVRMFNKHTKNYFYEVTYDHVLEGYKNSRERVEITYIFDSGNDEKIRCYVGKSTGWVPCYLEIKRRDSSGGGGLLSSCIGNIRGLNSYAY